MSEQVIIPFGTRDKMAELQAELSNVHLGGFAFVQGADEDAYSFGTEDKITKGSVLFILNRIRDSWGDEEAKSFVSNILDNNNAT